MLLSKSLSFLILSVILLGCTGSAREEQLVKREQELIEKEKQFAIKAADYQSLIQMRDSLLSHKDSLVTPYWPVEIEGAWNGKTLCKESNCNDYVVGDQRTDIWEFANDSTGRFTKILNNGKLLRVFSVNADSTTISLHFRTDSTASRKVEINVLLNSITDDLIKGTQTVTVNDDCAARFSVELARASKK